MIKKEHYIYDLVEECEKLSSWSNGIDIESIIHDVKLRITRHEAEEDMIYLTLIGLKHYITDEIDYINWMGSSDMSEYEKELNEINRNHREKLEEFRKKIYEQNM